jgi:hypothetical protein
VISALVLLAAVGFTLVAAYQWAGRLGAFDVTSRELAVRNWQGHVWQGHVWNTYSPSSSGWFGFTARKHLCPEEVPRGERRPAEVIGAAVRYHPISGPPTEAASLEKFIRFLVIDRMYKGR